MNSPDGYTYFQSPMFVVDGWDSRWDRDVQEINSVVTDNVSEITIDMGLPVTDIWLKVSYERSFARNHKTDQVIDTWTEIITKIWQAIQLDDERFLRSIQDLRTKYQYGILELMVEHHLSEDWNLLDRILEYGGDRILAAKYLGSLLSQLREQDEYEQPTIERLLDRVELWSGDNLIDTLIPEQLSPMNLENGFTFPLPFWFSKRGWSLPADVREQWVIRTYYHPSDHWTIGTQKNWIHRKPSESPLQIYHHYHKREFLDQQFQQIINWHHLIRKIIIRPESGVITNLCMQVDGKTIMDVNPIIYLDNGSYHISFAVDGAFGGLDMTNFNELVIAGTMTTDTLVTTWAICHNILKKDGDDRYSLTWK